MTARFQSPAKFHINSNPALLLRLLSIILLPASLNVVILNRAQATSADTIDPVTSRTPAASTANHALTASPVKFASHTTKTYQNVKLRAYTARYVLLDDGDKLGKAVRILQRIKKGWRLTSETKAHKFVFHDKRTEVSEFHIKNGIFFTDHYRYKIDNSFSSKFTEEYHDWELGLVRGHRDKDRQWQFPVRKNLADPLNNQLMLRLILLQQPQLNEVHFAVSSKGTVHLRTYTRLGTEKLKIQGKVYPSVKFEWLRGPRRTVFWLAKNLDYIPVKIYQEKNGNAQASLELTNITFQPGT